MSVIYRPARPEDFPTVDALVVCQHCPIRGPNPDSVSLSGLENQAALTVHRTRVS
jgi:hypothetical protein